MKFHNLLLITGFHLAAATMVMVVAASASTGKGKAIPQGRMDPQLVSRVYSGTEKFHYELSYTGGIKIGELRLEISPISGTEDAYELYALVTTANSIFDKIYPVHDVHVTKVKGKRRLPYSYEVWQKEGYNYQAHRFTRYDQNKGHIRYTKNDDKPIDYSISGPTHNEFSSFLSSRLMSFTSGSSFFIPTFADRKRVEVEVKVTGRKHLKKTSLGPVDAVKVMPILPFKGLYDKRGGTVIWYTDDECRIPVKIRSKLAIGSVTSQLLSYENSACSKYSGVVRSN